MINLLPDNLYQLFETNIGHLALEILHLHLYVNLKYQQGTPENDIRGTALITALILVCMIYKEFFIAEQPTNPKELIKKIIFSLEYSLLQILKTETQQEPLNENK